MGIFRNISDKIVFNEYCNLYSKWFNEEKPLSKEMNTKELVKLIEKQYNNMSEKEINIELISLEERINITKTDNKCNIRYCFYKLCFDVLNQCKNNKDEENGFLIELGDWMFGTLEKLSIFNIIRKLKNNTSYKFVDLWVVGNLIFAILSSIFVYNLSIENKYMIYIILIYACLRVFEVIIYQINVLLFHPYRSKKAGKEYKIKSVTRMVIALLYNYVEIMFWYSTMIISIITLNKGNVYNSLWIEYIRSNVLCIATLDGNILKDVVVNQYKYLTELIFWEIISGIIMTVISLARFIGALPAVESKE